VETLLAAVLDHVLVAANTGGLKGLGAQLLILVGDEVNAEREVVDVGTLATEIEDANLGVGYTTVEARLGVRLRKVLAVAHHRDMRYEVQLSEVLRSHRRATLMTFATILAPIPRPSKTSAQNTLISLEFRGSPCSCSNGSNGRDGEPS
jgi:hypothetical protein